MISLSLLRFRLLKDGSPTIFYKLKLFVGPQRPAMEEQTDTLMRRMKYRTKIPVMQEWESRIRVALVNREIAASSVILHITRAWPAAAMVGPPCHIMMSIYLFAIRILP